MSMFSLSVEAGAFSVECSRRQHPALVGFTNPNDYPRFGPNRLLMCDRLEELGFTFTESVRLVSPCVGFRKALGVLLLDNWITKEEIEDLFTAMILYGVD